ncbi:MAG: CopG family transcriptional regulator [Nitrospira sp.]|nr:MAG: CopG family transcriptional regulator [Nitrospira sp.]
MKAKVLEKMFDERKDVTPHLVLSNARRPGHEQRRVNVDFPNWIIESLDAQASRLGVTRQSVIKMWIAERLKEEMKRAS